MTDPRLHGHALVALGLTAMFLATSPQQPEPQEPAPAPAFLPIQPFDEQLVALQADIPDGDADATTTTTATTTTAPPDPASGLFAA